MFKEVAGVEAKSASVSLGATVPVTRELVDWADNIFVLEEKVDESPRKNRFYYGKIIVLK